MFCVVRKTSMSQGKISAPSWPASAHGSAVCCPSPVIAQNWEDIQCLRGRGIPQSSKASSAAPHRRQPEGWVGDFSYVENRAVRRAVELAAVRRELHRVSTPVAEGPDAELVLEDTDNRVERGIENPR
jgi:hypothetical protein